MTAVVRTRPAVTRVPVGAPSAAPWSLGEPRLLAGVAAGPVTDLHAHLAVHGPLPAAGLDRIERELAAAPLLGRGGAGFPLLRKLAALPGGGRRVVVNGAESEPASRKDRTLLTRAPHLVIDGAVAAARAIGAGSVTIAVHDGRTAAPIAAAIRQRHDGLPVAVRLTAPGFVAGEARALLRALDGGPALPPGRRTHACADGDLVSNAETFAQLAVLVRLGAARFAATGTRTEPGTTLLTVGGAVARPGVAEVPLGTPLGVLLQAVGADDVRHVVVGGYHGRWLPPDPDTPLSRAGLAAAGGALGAGVVLVLSSQTCALGELARVAGWLAAQSAQQCGPCRFGLPALAADIDALWSGHPRGLPEAHRHLALVENRGACSHPTAAVGFLRSGLRELQAEVVAHRAAGCGRPVLGELGIGAPR